MPRSPDRWRGAWTIQQTWKLKLREDPEDQEVGSDSGLWGSGTQERGDKIRGAGGAGDPEERWGGVPRSVSPCSLVLREGEGWALC